MPRWRSSTTRRPSRATSTSLAPRRTCRPARCTPHPPPLGLTYSPTPPHPTPLFDASLGRYRGRHTHHSSASLRLLHSCHCIALAHSTLDNFKEALNWEKKNYTILSNLLGEKDFRTSESNIWLKQFTRKAVQVRARRPPPPLPPPPR